MKRIIIFSVAILVYFLAPQGLFAGGKLRLTVTNNTGAVIERIELKERDNPSVMESIDLRIEKGESAAIQISKNTVYDIVLVDTEGHKYRRAGNKWKKDGVLVFRTRDFVHESFIRTLERAFPFNLPSFSWGG